MILSVTNDFHRLPMIWFILHPFIFIYIHLYNNNNNPGPTGTGGSENTKSCKDHDGAQGCGLSRPTTRCCGKTDDKSKPSTIIIIIIRSIIHFPRSNKNNRLNNKQNKTHDNAKFETNLFIYRQIIYIHIYVHANYNL